MLEPSGDAPLGRVRRSSSPGQRWSPGHPLRLLAVSHATLGTGGAERVLLRTLEAALAAKWEVTCVAPPGDLALQLCRLGVHWEPGPEFRRVRPGPLGLAQVIGRLLRGGPGGAAHLHGLASWADVVLANGVRALPLLALARPAAPVAWMVHDVTAQPSLRWMTLVCAGVVDLAIGVSAATAAVAAPLGLPTTVVYNGTDWPVHPAPEEPAPPITIGCAAAISPWKGQHVLIEAFAQLDRPDLHLELMGACYPKDVAYEQSLRQRAAQLGLAHRVHFLGQVDDPLERMRRWSVAVVASVDPEAGPLTMIEAMSIGVPVVATAHGCPTEILGPAGLLVPPGEPGPMATALGRLLDDRELRRRCRVAGRAKVERDLTLEGRRAALLEVLADVAARGPTRRWALRAPRAGRGRGTVRGGWARRGGRSRWWPPRPAASR